MMAKRHSIAASLAETTAEQPQVVVEGSRGARGTRKPRQGGKAAQEPAQGQPTAPRAESPTVRTAPSTTTAKRVGLYLHEDDFRALGLARLEDGADANARIRAMIAVWRANPRIRTQVDRLARTAPKSR